MIKPESIKCKLQNTLDFDLDLINNFDLKHKLNKYSQNICGIFMVQIIFSKMIRKNLTSSSNS